MAHPDHIKVLGILGPRVEGQNRSKSKSGLVADSTFFVLNSHGLRPAGRSWIDCLDTLPLSINQYLCVGNQCNTTFGHFEKSISAWLGLSAACSRSDDGVSARASFLRSQRCRLDLADILQQISRISPVDPESSSPLFSCFLNPFRGAK